MQLRVGVEGHGSVRSNDQAAVGQGPRIENLQGAAGDRGAAGVGIRAAEAQPARAGLGQTARAADGPRQRGAGRVVLLNRAVLAQGDGIVGGECVGTDDVEQARAATAEGQAGGSQVCAGGDGQRAGGDGGSAGVGVDSRESERPVAILGQAAVQAGGRVQQRLVDRNGIAVGVDYRAAGLDTGVERAAAGMEISRRVFITECNEIGAAGGGLKRAAVEVEVARAAGGVLDLGHGKRAAVEVQITYAA